MAMMKHMAAAVLYAVVGLLGPGDASVGSTDADGDDDSSLECVSYASEPGRRESSLVLSAASRLCGEQIDGAWVITHRHRPAAAAAVHQTHDYVAMVDLAVEPSEPAEVNSTLLNAALDRCRAHDALKVVVHAQGMELNELRVLAEQRGYRFSQASTTGDVAEVEFYTDLYWSDSHALG